MTINDAKDLIKLIGGSTYLVGGAVRDMVMGIHPKDYDFCTNVPMEKLEEMFETHDIGKNKDFGILVIKYKGEFHEIAQFRSEGKYSDGRHPDKVEYVSTVEEDLARRDFTINAMAYDGENIIDPFGGMKDLSSATLRFVGDARKRIEEDGLRVVRAYRFAARFGFKIEDEQVMNGYYINGISQERLTDELRKVASYGGKELAMFLDKMRLNGIYFPIGIDYNGHYPHQDRHHPEGDVWRHTLSCLCQSYSTDYLVNLAILFHDIGKFYTLALREGRPTYYNHDQYDFEEIGRSMKLSSDEIKTIQYVIKNHMVWWVDSRKKAKLLPMILHDDYGILEQVTYCDEMSRLYLGDVDRHTRISNLYKSIAKDYENKESLDLKIKESINGNMILKQFPGIKPENIGWIKGKIVEVLMNKGFEGVDVLSLIDYYGKACTSEVVLSSTV